MFALKEVFFPATTLSTLSAEFMPGTWTGGLEPGSRHWNKSHSVGLGFRGEVGISPGAPDELDSSSSSVPIDHRLRTLLWGTMGLGMPLPSVPTGCIRSRVWDGGGGY